MRGAIAVPAVFVWMLAAQPAHAAFEYQFAGIGPYGGSDGGPTDAAGCEAAMARTYPTPLEACQAVAAAQPMCDRRSAVYRNHVATLNSPSSCNVSWEYLNSGGGTWSGYGGSYPILRLGCPDGQKAPPNNPTACVPIIEKDMSQGRLPPEAPTCGLGNPIFPLTGAKKERITTGITLGARELTLTYDTTSKTPADQAISPSTLVEPHPFGPLWRSSLHHRLHVSPGMRSALLSRGDGLVLSFDGNGSGAFTPVAGNPHRLAAVGGGYLFSDVSSGELETFDSTGKLILLTEAGGSTLSFLYSGANLVQVVATDGRRIAFTYTGGLISGISGTDGAVVGVSYSAEGNLTSLTWPDGKSSSFLYENTALPWALTAKVDENGVPVASFSYDNEGRAIGTQRAGGVDQFSVAYTTPPARTFSEVYDPVANVYYRYVAWQPPSPVTFVGPNGEAVSMEGAIVSGMPAESGRTQPAGSGCPAAASSIAYDLAGNVASIDDFSRRRTCYAYDLRGRQTERIEGLATGTSCSSLLGPNGPVPAGARRVTTAWHPDWHLPAGVTVGLRRTTLVYNGQVDPTAGNSVATCAPGTGRPDGLPSPLVCKRVEQSLLGGGALDTETPPWVTSYTYDAAGRVLTETDANNRVTTSAYFLDSSFTADPVAADVGHRLGDLRSVTNAAGHVTQFNLYDPAGRVRRMTDPKGVVTDITYTPRGWVHTVAVTAPGAVARTTTYSYDFAGQLIGVAAPDGTSVSYTYDAAHRLVGATDARGNSVTYTLDNSGGRVAEEVRDPSGQLQRAITRSFDALSRLQQISGGVR